MMRAYLPTVCPECGAMHKVTRETVTVNDERKDGNDV
jgi:hypothetical protein